MGDLCRCLETFTEEASVMPKGGGDSRKRCGTHFKEMAEEEVRGRMSRILYWARASV